MSERRFLIDLALLAGWTLLVAKAVRNDEALFAALTGATWGLMLSTALINWRTWRKRHPSTRPSA